MNGFLKHFSFEPLLISWLFPSLCSPLYRTWPTASAGELNQTIRRLSCIVNYVNRFSSYRKQVWGEAFCHAGPIYLKNTSSNYGLNWNFLPKIGSSRRGSGKKGHITAGVRGKVFSWGTAEWERNAALFYSIFIKLPSLEYKQRILEPCSRFFCACSQDLYIFSFLGCHLNCNLKLNLEINSEYYLEILKNRRHTKQCLISECLLFERLRI